jgi:Glycosyl transferase family 2
MAGTIAALLLIVLLTGLLVRQKHGAPRRRLAGHAKSPRQHWPAIMASPSGGEGAIGDEARLHDLAGPLDGRAAHPTICVVIPTLNEAANLPHVLTRLPACVDELIVVDGNSVDDTIAVAQAIRPDVRIIRQDGRGKGNALQSGFAAATGDIIVMLDADGSTDPQEIPQFVQALMDGNDIAKGSRFTPGGGSSDITGVRRLGNRALNLLVNVLFGTRYTDLCYGYNAFWSHCLEHMQVDCDGFEVESLINVRVAVAGLSVAEVPSVEHERLFGESKLHAVRDGLRVLRTIATERLRVDRPRPGLGTTRPMDARQEFRLPMLLCSAERCALVREHGPCPAGYLALAAAPTPRVRTTRRNRRR